MNQVSFTPALGYDRLTPLYDLAIALLTRERYWRGILVSQVAPGPEDRILDVGCGTGTLAIRLKQLEPKCEIVGLDPDPRVLARARRKARRMAVDIDWRLGFLKRNSVENIGVFSKVVSSLVLHQTPIDVKQEILRSALAVLKLRGTLHIADYGRQESFLMRALFRNTVQRTDGKADTQPNADGALPDLITSAGFVDVKETDVIPTVTGSISIYRASANRPPPTTNLDQLESTEVNQVRP